VRLSRVAEQLKLEGHPEKISIALIGEKHAGLFEIMKKALIEVAVRIY
jgi:hypothetical protein